MRAIYAGLIAAALVAGCSKPDKPPTPAMASSPAAPGTAAPPSATAPAASAAAAPATGPAISGTYIASGKAAALAFVTAHTDEPFDGQPVTALVFSTKDQSGSSKPATDALFGTLGEAMVIKVQPDGKIIEADLIHAGLEGADRSVSLGGVLEAKNFSNAGGQISGTITSNGPHDVFGHALDLNVTFQVKAP